jgi:hypothetical protein
MEPSITPTLEEILKYNQAKAILNAPCVIVVQIHPNVTIINEYEEKFNVPPEDRFKSNYMDLCCDPKEYLKKNQAIEIIINLD